MKSCQSWRFWSSLYNCSSTCMWLENQFQGLTILDPREAGEINGFIVVGDKFRHLFLKSQAKNPILSSWMSSSWQMQMMTFAGSCLNYYSLWILATLTFYWPYDMVGALHSRSSHLSTDMVIVFWSYDGVTKVFRQLKQCAFLSPLSPLSPSNVVVWAALYTLACPERISSSQHCLEGRGKGHSWCRRV